MAPPRGDRVSVLSMGSQVVDSEGDSALWVLVRYPSVVQERIHQEGDRSFWKVLLSYWGSWRGLQCPAELGLEGQSVNQPIVFCCHRKAVTLGKVASSAGSLSIG